MKSWKMNLTVFCFLVILSKTFSYHYDDGKDEENVKLDDMVREIVVEEIKDEAERIIKDEVEDEDFYKGHGGDSKQIRFRDFENVDKNANFEESKGVYQDAIVEDSNEKLCLALIKDATRHGYVTRILSALDRLVKHFEYYSDQMIADGLFGLRFAEGALMKLVSKLNKKNLFYNKALATLDRLKKLNAISYKKTMAHKKVYDLQFDAVLKGPYTIFWPKKSLKSLEHHIDKKDLKFGEMNEPWSDHCICLLLGTAKDSTGQKCVVTKKCLETEMEKKTTHYTLTHQFLYFVAGFVQGCDSQFAEAIGSQEKVMFNFERMAANIAYQMLHMHGEEPSNLGEVDVQVEQGLMCGLYGIVDCTQPPMVERLASYVNAKGCSSLGKKQKRNEKRTDLSIGGCSQHLDGLMTAYMALSLETALTLPTC